MAVCKRCAFTFQTCDHQEPEYPVSGKNDIHEKNELEKNYCIEPGHFPDDNFSIYTGSLQSTGGSIFSYRTGNGFNRVNHGAPGNSVDND